MDTFDVVFMGSENFSLPILKSLAVDDSATQTRVVGVVTQPDRPAGRGRKVAQSPVKVFAAESGIPVLQPERLRDEASIASVLQLKPQLIVVASYGQIVPRMLLNAPRYGSLNLHPSLLPRYRGASPVTGPILAGDRETGTTLMLMGTKMDAGPILGQETTPVHADETAGELEERLARLSAGLLARLLRPWIQDEIQPVEQDERQATYTSRIEKVDGLIDWEQPGDVIARQVRAYNPWPAAFTSWDGRMLKILRAHASPGEASPGRVVTDGPEPFAVGTGRGLLSVDEMQIAGSRSMTPSEILRGHRELSDSVLGGIR